MNLIMTLLTRFIEGTTFTLFDYDGDKHLYRIDSCSGQLINLIDILFSNNIKVNLCDLEEALAEKRIEFNNDIGKPSESPQARDLAALPDVDQLVVLRKYNYINMLEQCGTTSWTQKSLTPHIATIAKKIGDQSPPSWRTIARWYKAFKSQGTTVRALYSDRLKKGNRNSRLDKEIEHLIEKAIEHYKTDKRVTIQNALDKLDAYITKANKSKSLDEYLSTPAYETFRQRILAQSPYELMKTRLGKRKADIEFNKVGTSIKQERVMQRVEVDHTKLDIFLVDDHNHMPLGRPWLSIATDTCSRSIVGVYFGFNPPSFLSLTKLLKSTILHKKSLNEKYPGIKNTWLCHGVPEVLVFDNGKEFWSNDLEILLAELNVQVQYNPVQKPWLKGKVERLFGTINKKLLVNLPGKTFSNIFEKGDYDPEKSAVIQFSIFAEMLYTWIIDVYQQSPTAKGTIIPDEAWKNALLDFPPRQVNPEALTIILGRVKRSKLRRGGLEFLGLRYDSKDLAKLRGKIGSVQATYKINPDDLGVVHVLDETTNRYFPVPATDQEYAAGLSEWQHTVNRRFTRMHIRKNFKHDDVVAARDRIQELINEAINQWETKRKKGKAKTNARLARMKKVADRSTDTDNTAPIVDATTALQVLPETSEKSESEWSVPTDRSGWSTSGGDVNE